MLRYAPDVITGVNSANAIRIAPPTPGIGMTALNPDLFITPSESLTARSFLFPESMAGQLRAIPGIGDVQGVRDARIPIRGKPIMFVATDVEALRHHATLPPVAGDVKEMFRLTAAGQAVLASENFALLGGYKLGWIGVGRTGGHAPKP